MIVAAKKLSGLNSDYISRFERYGVCAKFMKRGLQEHAHRSLADNDHATSYTTGICARARRVGQKQPIMPTAT
jgi:hypothetical protein